MELRHEEVDGESDCTSQCRHDEEGPSAVDVGGAGDEEAEQDGGQAGGVAVVEGQCGRLGLQAV